MSSDLTQGLTIGFLGAGNLGEALLRGLLTRGVVPKERLLASTRRPERAANLANSLGISAATNEALAARADVVVLSVKPQVVPSVLPALAANLRPGTRVISVAAGVPLATLAAGLPDGTRIVRAMPNTPALVNAAITALAAGPGCTPDDVALATQLFEAVGRTLVVDESQLDAVTGLSGSGPAYVFLVIEALADGGVRMGLPRAQALTLALQTVLGAAQLASTTGEHPALLREKVTSPGGTTIAGLHALERHGLRAALIDAVQAATERARELSKKT